jgi:hypothetical protein
VSEPYTPSAVAPTFPLTLPLDGEVINHSILIDGIVKPALDYTAAAAALTAAYVTSIAKQTASSGDTLVGVLTYVGRFLTLPTGTLRTVLQFIANNSITDAPSQAITPSLTTYTADYAVARNFHVFTPNSGTGNLQVILKSTSPAPPEGAEMTIAAYVIADTESVTVEREGGTQIVFMLGVAAGPNFGFARFKNIGGTWRLMDATGLAAQWTATFPSSINSP